MFPPRTPSSSKHAAHPARRPSGETSRFPPAPSPRVRRPAYDAKLDAGQAGRCEHVLQLLVGKAKAAVSELEISRSRSRLKGALIGAGIGAITGVAWGAVERSRCVSQHGFPCDLSFIGPVIVVPPVGAILGFLIGKPQWRDVPVTL